MIQFDILLEKIGGAGKSQVLLFVLLAYFNISGGFNSIVTVFIAYSPEKRCSVPPIDNSTVFPNLTEGDILNYTTPYDTGNREYETCMRYGYDLSACNDDLDCVNQTYPPIKCDKGYHYDTSLFTQTVVTEFDLVCDRNYLNALSTSMFYAGMLIGSFLFGNMADRFGRKPTMIVSYAGMLACMFGVTYSTSVEMYMAFRAGTAAFQYGSAIGTFVYIMEICGYKWRAIFGLTYQCFYSIGYMSLSGIAYNWRDWHETMFVCTILSLPFLLFAMIIPESPRWLFTKGKDGPATKTTLRMAKFNGVRLTEEDWQRANVADEKIQLNENSNERKYSSIDLFKRPGIRLTTVKIMFNWFVNSFVFYGISLNAGALAGDIFVNNTLNGVMGMGSNIFCMLVMDKTGRRLLLTLMLLLAGCGLLVSAIINEFKGDDQGLETLGLVFAFAAKCGISGSFSVIYNFTAELYPTVVRSNGIGMGSLSARIGGIVAPFVISLQDYVSWLPNVIFGSLGVIAGLSALTFQETNGDTMMETLEEAEVFYKTGKLPKAKSLDKENKSGFNTDSSCDLKDMNIFTKL